MSAMVRATSGATRRAGVPRYLSLFAAMVVAAGTTAGCSFSIGSESVDDAAVELIQGEFADSYAMDLRDATCASPESKDVGTTFTCQAGFGDELVAFLVTVDREDHINVASTNVVYPPMLDAIASTVADSMNEQGDFGLTPDAVDCGEQSVVLGSDRSFLCALYEPGTANVFDTTIVMTDLDDLRFDFQVSPEPR